MKRFTPRFAVLLAIGSQGCGLWPASDQNGVTVTDAGVVDQGACDKIGRSRTLSESCCPTFGADACGATLFCAAFDGRAVPTCYPEYSRPAGAACTEDRQCMSGKCNTGLGKCAFAQGARCDPAIGCGSTDPLRPIALCVGYTSNSGLNQQDRSCRLTSALGGECGLCNQDSDCGNPSLSCVTNACVARSGGLVSDASCCLNGYSYSSSGQYHCK